MVEKKVVGLTKDVGWQMGIRRTFPISVEEAREFLFSSEGVTIWLGKLKDSELEVGTAYKTSSGIEGVVKVLKPLSHIRMTWKKKEWDNFSTLQIRVLSAKEKATISFHQEKLKDEKQRKEMLQYWEEILLKLEAKLKSLTGK